MLRSLARIVTESVALLRTVVVRTLPFQRATVPPRKCVPVTIRVKAGPPCRALAGWRAVSVGTALYS
jgi:hypothetical protein